MLNDEGSLTSQLLSSFYILPSKFFDNLMVVAYPYYALL